MTPAHQRRQVFLLFCLVAIPLGTFGQEATPSRYWGIGGPFTAVPVQNAPFSADATLTFTRTLPDGTRSEQRARARYYRDSAGRVRADWVDIGSSDPRAGRYTSVWVSPYPDSLRTFVVDPSDQTFRDLPRSIAAQVFSAGNAFMMPAGRDTYRNFFDYRDWGTIDHVVLGERRIEGLDTVGQRLTITLPDQAEPGLVEERWESPELNLVIYSHAADAHAGAYGSVEYRLTNINGTEPPPELFVAPGAIVYGADKNPGRALISFGPGCVVGCGLRRASRGR